MSDIKELLENAVKIKILSTDFDAPRKTRPGRRWKSIGRSSWKVNVSLPM